MPIWDGIAAKIGGRKSLNDVKIEELQAEKIRLDQAEGKLSREVDLLERTKKDLFQKGMNESSDRQRAILSRRVIEKDAEAAALDRQLRTISHQIRIVNGLLLFKREAQNTKASPVLSKITLPELAGFVETATVQGELVEQGFQEILGVIEGGTTIAEGIGSERDKKVQEMMETMAAAHEAAMQNPESAGDTGFAEMDRVLHQEEPEGNR